MTAAALPPDRALAAFQGIGQVEQRAPNRVEVRIEPRDLRRALEAALRSVPCDRFMQLAAADGPDTIELRYNLTGPHRAVVTLVTKVPRGQPRIASVHDIAPPAGLYERQVHDLFGVDFEGHPGLARLVLNEGWPEGEFPLRKDWKKDPDHDYGGVPAGVRH